MFHFLCYIVHDNNFSFGYFKNKKLFKNRCHEYFVGFKYSHLNLYYKFIYYIVVSLLLNICILLKIVTLCYLIYVIIYLIKSSEFTPEDHCDIHKWQESKLLCDASMVRVKTIMTLAHDNNQSHYIGKFIIMSMLI